jgi:hypothetical protein
LLTQKVEEADYTFHQMVKLKGIKTENVFMKALHLLVGGQEELG